MPIEVTVDSIFVENLRITLMKLMTSRGLLTIAAFSSAAK